MHTVLSPDGVVSPRKRFYARNLLFPAPHAAYDDALSRSNQMANPLSRFEQRIAQRARALNSSAIREILRLTERAQMISFAGGIPSPAAFPLDALTDATAHARAHAPALTMDFDA
jgi:DNA-binding transcriptional MocR family regulator